MNKTLILSLLVGLGLFGGRSEDKTMNQQDKPERQTEQHLERQITVKLDYLSYLPPDYDKQDSWPLMVFLHGAGERGSDLEKVKVHGPPKLIEEGKDLPFIIVSPQCPNDQWWPGLEREVIALVDEMIDTYKVDKSRVYLTGLSMGGYGTWAIGCSYPKRFAALVPICGGGRPFRASALKDVPVWAFHGAKDPVVPLQESRQMVHAVTAAGGDAQLTVYPEAEHDSWTQTYANPRVYEWMLEHKKTQD